MEISIKVPENTSLNYLITKPGYFGNIGSWDGSENLTRSITLENNGWTLVMPINYGKFYVSSHNGLILFNNGSVYKINGNTASIISSGLNANAIYSEYRDEFYYFYIDSNYSGSTSVYTPTFIRYSNNGSGSYNYSKITNGSTNFANAAVFGNATWTEQRHSTYTSCRWYLECSGITAEGPYFVAPIYYGDFDSKNSTYYVVSGARTIYSSDGNSWSGVTHHTFAGTASSSDYYDYQSSFYPHSANGHYILASTDAITSRTGSWGYLYGTNPGNLSYISSRDYTQYYHLGYTKDLMKYAGNNLYYSTYIYSSKGIYSTDGYTLQKRSISYPSANIEKINYYNGLYYGMYQQYLWSTSDFSTFTLYVIPPYVKSWIGVYDSKIYVLTNDGLFYKPVSELQPLS